MSTMRATYESIVKAIIEFGDVTTDGRRGERVVVNNFQPTEIDVIYFNMEEERTIGYSEDGMSETYMRLTFRSDDVTYAVNYHGSLERLIYDAGTIGQPSEITFDWS